MPKVRSQVRKELTDAVRGRYRTATRVEKSKILDEFVALTGLHRKHAVRVLNRPAGTASPRRASTRAPVYDEAVAQALMLLPALERHGHLGLDPTVREKLLQISPATIDRLLAPKRNGGVRG